MPSTGTMFSDIHDPSARVRALCDYGCKVVDVDPSIPPKRYLRSGLEMIRMANVYYEEHNLESAFILYSKFVSLFVEKLPRHPEFKSTPQAERSKNKKKCMEAFDKADSIKKKLIEIYTREELKRQEAERKRREELARQEAERQKELEAQRLKEEERRRVEEQRKLAILQEQEKKRAMAGGDTNQDSSGALDKTVLTDNNIGADIVSPVPLVMPGDVMPTVPTDLPASQPSAPPLDFDNLPPPPSYDSVVPSAYGKPVLPPVIPSRDLKKNVLGPTVGGGSPAVDSAGPAVPDRGSKPSLDHFTSVGQTTSTNRFGLKDIMVPSDLVEQFIKVAQDNTRRNVETCGILSGKLSHGAFKITHLLIPKQSGTSDSCTTEGEEALFDYQDAHDLITLGWIHTHPSQTAFLSSVDLHTHCSYQLMMPEAIAIVYSPKFDETGIFYLTPDHGLDYIANCRQAGFHPHPKDPALFDEACHAKIDASARITLVDLRRR